jgi:hypothetical protein
MHNTCIAAGPDFRKGAQDYLPSGNIDIAPMVAWILGVEHKQKFSGRVLREALAQTGSTTTSIEPRHLEASRSGKGFAWKQYLNFSEVNGVVYFDEGNGTVVTGAGTASVQDDATSSAGADSAKASASH